MSSVEQLRAVEWFEPLREKNGFHHTVKEDEAYGYRDFKVVGVFRPHQDALTRAGLIARGGTPVYQIVEVQFILSEFLKIKK